MIYIQTKAKHHFQSDSEQVISATFHYAKSQIWLLGNCLGLGAQTLPQTETRWQLVSAAVVEI